jgi:ubiquinone/menaquinone biosynthesis C-methylase UbiE
MFSKMIEKQYRKPSGLLGRFIGGKMAQQHSAENLWTVSLLNIKLSDHVLEIGFGPGVAIEAAARLASAGLVAGIDASGTMVDVAKKRNREAVRAGRVDVRQGDAAVLPFGAEMFDKVFSIHSVYFWRDAAAVLREVHQVLKPGGLIALTVMPKEKWPTASQGGMVRGDYFCQPYSDAELSQMLVEAGFANPRTAADDAYDSNFTVMANK